jgi:4-coumarate--CoA ligase
LIKNKRFQVPPAELEGLLLTHPANADCVVETKDEKAGEFPKAFVVLKPEQKVTEDEIMKWNLLQKVFLLKRRLE